MRANVLQNLLTDCVSCQTSSRVDPTRIGQLAELDWHGLVDLANEHRVGPLLYYRLSANGYDEMVPADTLADLRQRFRANGMRNLDLYGDLHRMLVALRAEGIPVVVLKGAFLAEVVYDQIALREMNDVDLLLPLDRLRAGWAVFEAHGFRPLRPSTLETELETSEHLPKLFRANGPGYELHGNLVSPQRTYSVGVEEFWERVVPALVAGSDVLALSTPDLLLHLCAHSSYSHQLAFGLRPYCDITETIEYYAEDLDWEAVVRRAERLGWTRGVFVALRLAKDLVGAAVPGDVLARLQAERPAEVIVELAREQVFTPQESTGPMSTTLPRLWAPVGTAARLRHLVARLFSARVVAARYSLPVGSPRVFLYYPVRILHLLRDHAGTAWRLWRGDSGLKRSAERRHRLSSWLGGDQFD